ncbi:MAG: hypothetical protein ACE5GW_02150 [Planctomycetota bacterium]
MARTDRGTRQWRIPSILALAAAALLPGLGCKREVRPEILAGIDECRECRMIIDRVNQGCGAVIDGAFVAFDSPACLLRHLGSLRARAGAMPTALFFADCRDAVLHPAEKTTFLLSRHRDTVMESGVLCFGSREAAEALREHEDETVTDWPGYRTARGEPDRVVELSIGAGGMSPEVVEVARGDLVLWRIRGPELERDLIVSLGGYPEMGSFTVPASGEEVECRLLALRPGSGFPFTSGDGGRALGRLRVTGAHTDDEDEEEAR